MTQFAPSVYQQQIFDWIADPHPAKRHGIVNAVAGSGKTTTLVQAARLLKEPALFVAFNTHIVKELTERLAGTQMIAKTMHSVGNAAIARELGMNTTVVEKKYDTMVKGELQQKISEWKDLQPVLKFVMSMVDLTRSNLIDATDETAVLALADHHGLELPKDEYAGLAMELIPDVLARGKRQAERSGLIDFTDMIWLPAKWELKPPQFMWLMADECQDFNAAQLALALSCIHKDGRSLFVGDPNQAIYGFAGADAESFHRIQRRLNAQELPLSICYRCPASHVALAKQIVPQIEARPDAPDGLISSVGEGDLGKHVKAGDYVLCRLTAPLVSACIDLIKQRIPAYVRGRDIGKKLTTIIDATVEGAGTRYEWAKFGEWLTAYYEFQHQKLMQRENADSAIQSLIDQVDAVRVCYERFNAVDEKDLARQIDGLFKDLTNAVTLCTVHRAKGLEGERVFILKNDKLPLVWANQKPWEADQEMNLRYVALTRAKNALYFIGANVPGIDLDDEETPPALCVKNTGEIPSVDDNTLDVPTVSPHTDMADLPTMEPVVQQFVERTSVTADFIAKRSSFAPAMPKTKKRQSSSRKSRKS